MTLSNTLNTLMQRAADLALRSDTHVVLNNQQAHIPTADLAGRLMAASKALISSYADPLQGGVDYTALRQSERYAAFRRLTGGLRTQQLENLEAGPARTAFWINIYNALIIDAVIQYDLRGSMMRRPGIFRQTAYLIGGLRFSADDIEHGILRRNRRHPLLGYKPFNRGDARLDVQVEHLDPRIHFALVCGAQSCPPVAFYSAERLEAQLDQAAGAFINGGGVRWEPARSTLWLSKIFKWYEGDFGGRAAILSLIQRHARDPLLRGLPAASRPRLRFLHYDWRINAPLAEAASGSAGNHSARRP